MRRLFGLGAGIAAAVVLLGGSAWAQIGVPALPTDAPTAPVSGPFVDAHELLPPVPAVDLLGDGSTTPDEGDLSNAPLENALDGTLNTAGGLIDGEAGDGTGEAVDDLLGDGDSGATLDPIRSPLAKLLGPKNDTSPIDLNTILPPELLSELLAPGAPAGSGNGAAGSPTTPGASVGGVARSATGDVLRDARGVATSSARVDARSDGGDMADRAKQLAAPMSLPLAAGLLGFFGFTMIARGRGSSGVDDDREALGGWSVIRL